MTAKLDLNASLPLECLAYRFDIVLRGSRQTLFENKLHGRLSDDPTLIYRRRRRRRPQAPMCISA